MNLLRKISVYLIGFSLGCVLVYRFFRNRNFPHIFPQDVIIAKLNSEPMTYSRHALCRMECRHITEPEVKEILKNGKVNFSKSRVHAKPCPSYAIEGVSSEGQHIRIVVGNCDSIAVLITAMDLINNYPCDCK